MVNKNKPKVAPGVNYQNMWENATAEDKKMNNITRVTRLSYDEYDPIDRRNKNEDK